jgi:transposase-like protein
VKTKHREVCPFCGNDAVYRYGKTCRGKLRCLCLGCNRQFTVGAERAVFVPGRPSCPTCGKQMHLCTRKADAIWFRCSDRPQCKTYVKIRIEGGRNEPLPA